MAVTPTTHIEFLNQFQDERKPLVEAILLAIQEKRPDLTEIRARFLSVTMARIA